MSATCGSSETHSCLGLPPGNASAAGVAMVNLSLTYDMKQRIFAEYPAVHQLFVKLVHHEPARATHCMDEREFWVRYFRSKDAWSRCRDRAIS